ncbi:hypothetical protein HanXRQr2_Chr13g0574391 [Helianthus annuus]|uniref:Uncharacterized protein n=1 Tax=Helianthus annuus TaxID=4232 RepID=A0A251SPX1_HELAN|nr:hypothetical protein HanXRQr2_Chr13g0574391 [Helianthus annuus]
MSSLKVIFLYFFAAFTIFSGKRFLQIHKTCPISRLLVTKQLNEYELTILSN